MSLDLLPALRDAVMDIGGVTAMLAQWKGEPAVFTRRPVPDDAIYPVAVISRATSIDDFDGLTVRRPIATHQIAFYGNKGAPGSTEDHTRDVESMGFAAREHFHRNRFSLTPSGYSVVDVQVRGPVDAPVDDDMKVGTAITLQIRLGSTS